MSSLSPPGGGLGEARWEQLGAFRLGSSFHTLHSSAHGPARGQSRIRRPGHQHECAGRTWGHRAPKGFSGQLLPQL